MKLWTLIIPRHFWWLKALKEFGTHRFSPQLRNGYDKGVWWQLDGPPLCLDAGPRKEIEVAAPSHKTCSELVIGYPQGICKEPDVSISKGYVWGIRMSPSQNVWGGWLSFPKEGKDLVFRVVSCNRYAKTISLFSSKISLLDSKGWFLPISKILSISRSRKLFRKPYEACKALREWVHCTDFRRDPVCRGVL